MKNSLLYESQVFYILAGKLLPMPLISVWQMDDASPLCPSNLEEFRPGGLTGEPWANLLAAAPAPYTYGQGNQFNAGKTYKW